MVTIHTDAPQGSEAWLKARDGKYTGTSAHKLLKYGVIEYARTANTGFTGNFYTRRGHVLEDESIGIYEAIRHCRVDRPDYVTNDQFPDCLFSPDGLCDGTLIECKAFNQKKHLSIYGGDVPFEILAQIHFGLLICELKQARLLIYNPEFAKPSNPLYDPKKAFKMIEVRYNRNIANNFKRILGKETVHAQL